MSGAKRAPSKRRHTLSIEFVGRSFRSANVLGPFVRVSTENPSLVPDRFAVEEDDWRPFDEQELVGFADNVSNYLLQISRQKRLKYEAYLRQSAFGGASIAVDAATPVKDGGEVFALGDRLAQAYQPQIGWVQTPFERACPLKGSTEMIKFFSDGLHFRDCGPAGLGMRTYLGPRIVDLFGLTDADPSGATFTVRTSRAPRSPACAGKAPSSTARGSIPAWSSTRSSRSDEGPSAVLKANEQ